MKELWFKITLIPCYIKDFFVNLYLTIRSIIFWGYYGYKDCQWDGVFIYQVLKFKLERMLEFYSDPNAYSDNGKVIVEIKMAIDMLDALLKGDFARKEWDEIDINLREEIDNWLIDREMSEAAREKLHELCELEDKRAEEVKQKLFKYLADHLDVWWE